MRFLSFAVVLVASTLWFASPALAGNWGENWGSMIWGSAAAVPSLEGVGVWLLVISLFGAAAWRLRRRSIHASLTLVLLPLLPLLMAPHYTNWNAFANGDVADAAEVNQNFVLAAAALDDFEARVSALEAAANTNAPLTNAQVAAAAIAEGFVVGPHTNPLTEEQVIAFVANNGYSTGAHTTYIAGTGLTLAGQSFSADTAVVQARISSSCAVGAAIAAIAADGTVTCEAIAGAPSVTYNGLPEGTLTHINFDDGALELTLTTSTGLEITGIFF